MRHLHCCCMRLEMILDPSRENGRFHGRRPRSWKRLHPHVQSQSHGGYRTFSVDTATAVLHAVADRFLVNIQTDVVHSLHGGASLVVSESARSLSSAFLHQAPLHDLFIQTTRPEPHLYTSHNPVCAGIVDRFALFSEGGWDAFSKTPTASNPVICFRVELNLGAEPTRHSGADSHTAKGLSSPCGGRCSRWDHCRNGNGKSDGNRRILLPSQRSESAGALVPATPGSLAHTNEPRGIPLAARGRTHRFRSIQGDERLFRGYPEGLDAELSSPGSRQNGGPATSCGNRGQDGPAVLSQRS